MPSTAIRSYDYDPQARQLKIEFITGRRYAYDGVAPEVIEEMQRTQSKGGFFNRRIRDRYPYRRIGKVEN